MAKQFSTDYPTPTPAKSYQLHPRKSLASFVSAEQVPVMDDPMVEVAYRTLRAIMSGKGANISRDQLIPNRQTELYTDPELEDTNQGFIDDQVSSMLDTRQFAVSCLATLYIFITVIGLTSNAAVLYIIARSRRSKAVTSIYIFNLAIADLLYVVFLPAAVYPMLNGHWVLGHIMCKLYFTCDGVSKFASVMFLVVLSFDRYMAVCHPIASRAVRTAKVAFVASGASWLLVILAMIPVFVYATLVKVNASGQDTLQCVIYWPATPMVHAEGGGVNDTDPLYTAADSDGGVNGTDFQMSILAGNNFTESPADIGLESNESTAYTVFATSAGTDWARRIFTLYIFTLSFSAPLLLVWIFYIMIIHRLYTQKRTLFKSLPSNTASNLHSKSGDETPRMLSKSERAMLPANKANQRRRRSTRRVTIMVLSIVVAYTLCWVPYWCVQLTIEFFREDPALDFEIFTIVSYIAYGAQSINSALNPFLYAFGTHAHRRRLMNWLRRCVHLIGCDRLGRCIPHHHPAPVSGSSSGTGGVRRSGPPNVVITRYKHDVRMLDYHRASSPDMVTANERSQFLAVPNRPVQVDEVSDDHSAVVPKSPSTSYYSFSPIKCQSKPLISRRDSGSDSASDTYSVKISQQTTEMKSKLTNETMAECQMCLTCNCNEKRSTKIDDVNNEQIL